MTDKNYFDGEINEFVDWVNGDNSAEGANSTNHMPVSGGSIRQLLQSHLKKPIILEYNSVAGKNRLFPSAYARDLYNSDPDAYGDLLIAEFEAAAEYVIKLYSDSACTNEIDASNRDVYVKQGDSTSDNNSFRAYYKIFKGDDEYISNIYVQATVRNSDYKTVSTGSNFSAGSQIDVNLSPLLHEGDNTVELTIGAFIGTLMFLKTIRYTIHVIDLSISVKYDYNKSAGSNANVLTFSVYTKNTSGADVATVYKIDLGQEGLNTSVNSNQYTQYSPDISLLEEGVHTLQVMSYISVTNNSVQQYIHSNIVYIRFVKYTGQTALYNIVAYSSIDDRTSLLLANERPTLYFTQYNKASLDWALVSTSTSVLKSVTWKLLQYNDELWVDINTFDYIVGKETINTLTFTPIMYGDNYKLVGYIEDVEEITFDVVIKNAKFLINETDNYNLKLHNEQEYDNSNPQTHKWTSNYNGNEIACLFNRERILDAETPAFPWNSISGWGKECLHISPGDYCYIPYRFFSFNNVNAERTGATIEIEFEFRSITDTDDEIIVIGGENNKSKIVFTPTSATLYSDNNTYLVRTNFKSNERIKLAFVINPNQNAGLDTSLAYIVNNGILERANSYSNSFTATKGIKIGKQNAGADIYIYKIRAYNTALTPEQLFCNYALDNENTAEIIQNNDILTNSNGVDYSAVLNKLPVVFITGRMADIIGSTGKEMNLNVDLAKIDMSNSAKNIFINDCRIRKHGQSTLNYPIPSFKIWSNSSYTVTDPLSPDNGKTKKAVMYGCNIDGNGNPSPNTDITFYKGRYAMKDKSIPANKWVLQANYADSSGVHNGGIMKLITESWYNARVEVNGQKYYKLRTPPQLISSIPHSREGLDEADLYATPADRQAYNQWVANPNGPKSCMYEYNANGTVKLWSDCDMGEFPYDKIRVSPDSFPCVIFYRETENDSPVFLGQYVFMDDKKSDYIYGQRSIYKVKNDPFCLTQTNASNDKKENRLWNNDNVLRIEVVKINTDMVGYRSHTYDGKAFDEIVTVYKTDDDNNYVDKDGNIIQENELPTKGVPLSISPNWYNGFELVYPDPDDLTNSTPAGVNAAAKPFIDYHKWLCDTYEYWTSHGGQLEYLYNGSNYNPAHEGFSKFRAEAADHLDLYKLAAYYICFIRLGLVDSVERNAQLKTYDGIHWHYEPWDMDIALGNQNTGGIKWNPPMTRATNDGSIAAYSGTHLSNGVIDKSNWLWDALESWPHFQDIVRSVADALSLTLTYDNMCKVLDEEYAQKWCERIYNISGHFKYIETLGANMYNWLQGARTSHRHWWLKTSMDYYDARWTCGDFKNTGGYMNIKYNGNGTRPLHIGITAANKGFFCYAEEVAGNPTINSSSLIEIAGGHSGVITIPASANLEAKSPFYIYGCNNIKSLDLSDIYNEPGGSGGIQKMYFAKFIDSVSGSSLTSLNIGVPLNLMQQGVTNAENIAAINGLPDVLRSLEELNIQGCVSNGSSGEGSTANTVDYGSFLNNTENLKKLYAIGTDLTSFTSNNYQQGTNARTYKGGHYEVLLLPSTITALEFHDSSWDEYNNSSDPSTATGLSFWSYDKSTGTITSVPFSNTDIKTLKLYGTTLTNDCAIGLLKQFIAKAAASLNPEEYTLYFEGLNINGDYYQSHPLFTWTYQELVNMSYLNGGYNSGYNGDGDSIDYNYKGYLRLSDIDTTDPTTTSQRIQEIQSLFGENVFIKNSYNDNLVVDFLISTEQDELFLTVSSYRGNCYDATTNTVYEGYADNNNTIPNSIIIRASKFLLPDGARNQTLKIIDDDNNPRNEYLGAIVGNTEDLTVVVPEMKRRANGTSLQSLTLQVTDSSGEEDIVKTTSVLIHHKVYPSSISIDVVNSSGNHCYQDKRGNTINTNLNTATGSVTIVPVYPGGTSETDKVTILRIEFVNDANNDANFSITPDPTNPYKANIQYSLDLSDTPVICKILAKVVYLSGDTLDNFTINISMGKDEVIVDGTSNPVLYSILDSLNIPAMLDENTGKLFTKSSLAYIESIDFGPNSGADYATISQYLSNLTSFLVDVTDSTKGTLFDYISDDTTTIDISGCTNVALQTNGLILNATRFTKLTSFVSDCDCYVEFTYSATSMNTILDTIWCNNCGKLTLRNTLALDTLIAQDVKWFDVRNQQNVNPSTFNISFDYQNLQQLFADGLNGTKGVTWTNAIYDFISANPLPSEAEIDVTFTNTVAVSMNFLTAFARYIGHYQDYTKLVINGSVTCNIYYASTKAIIETYYNDYNGNVFVTNWGTMALELLPDSLNTWVSNMIGGSGEITPTALANSNLNTLCLDLYHNYCVQELITGDLALLTNALWLRHVTGQDIGQSKEYHTWFPNIKYLGITTNPGATTAVDFGIGRYSGVKAQIVVTNCLRPPYNDNPGYGLSSLYYKMILIPSSVVNGWYSVLANAGVITSGLTDENDKIVALETIDIYCRDNNGVQFTESYLMNTISEPQLDALMTAFSPSGHKYESTGRDASITVTSYLF